MIRPASGKGDELLEFKLTTELVATAGAARLPLDFLDRELRLLGSVVSYA